MNNEGQERFLNKFTRLAEASRITVEKEDGGQLSSTVIKSKVRG